MTQSASALPGFGVLRASGPDAAVFLHAQLASDVRALEPRDWQWSCYLTPQGRTQSAFLLFRAAPDEFLLAVPGDLAAPVHERLSRYRFRSRLELALDPEWQALGALEPGAPGDPRDGTLVAALPGSRRLLLARGARAGIDPDAALRWQLADIEHGVPVLTAAVTDGHTPQALSLDRLAAYSVKKGCYPGQEIVARTHFLGRSKRALARFEFESESPPAPGTDVVAAASAEPAGTVISAARKGSRAIELLATMREGRSGLHLAGRPETALRSLAFGS